MTSTAATFDSSAGPAVYFRAQVVRENPSQTGAGTPPPAVLRIDDEALNLPDIAVGGACATGDRSRHGHRVSAISFLQSAGATRPEGVAVGFEMVLVERDGPFVSITMNRPERRNALSLEHMRELIAGRRCVDRLRSPSNGDDRA